MNLSPFKIVSTSFSVISSIVVLLWWVSTKFNSLEIEQNHMRVQDSSMQHQINDIKKQIQLLPIHSQLLLTYKSNFNMINHRLTMMGVKINGLSKSLEGYVDKTYFYRDMSIIKNDFRTTNSKVYANTSEINYQRGLWENELNPASDKS